MLTLESWCIPVVGVGVFVSRTQHFKRQNLGVSYAPFLALKMHFLGHFKRQYY